jgi:hypothetical protein
MKIAAGIAAVSILAGCATSKGNQRHAQHSADQIKMVAVQREARLQEAQAESATQVALVQALSEVAKSNPDHAPAVTVALAVIGVRGSEGTSKDAPIIGLQQQRNEALEWTKALAPTLGNLASGLGVAAIQANVTKKQAEITRDIQINDANSDVAIVQAVAGLGTAAANNSGITAGGDVYQVQDQGVIDQSTDSSTTTTNETTYTASEEAFINTGVNDFSDRIIEFEGSAMTIQDLISLLDTQGASYSIDLDGDGTPDYTGGDGGTETVYVNCNDPQFSPMPPVCTGA